MAHVQGAKIYNPPQAAIATWPSTVLDATHEVDLTTEPYAGIGDQLMTTWVGSLTRIERPRPQLPFIGRSWP